MRNDFHALPAVATLVCDAVRVLTRKSMSVLVWMRTRQHKTDGSVNVSTRVHLAGVCMHRPNGWIVDVRAKRDLPSGDELYDRVCEGEAHRVCAIVGKPRRVPLVEVRHQRRERTDRCRYPERYPAHREAPPTQRRRCPRPDRRVSTGASTCRRSLPSTGGGQSGSSRA